MCTVTFPKCVLIMSSKRKIKSLNITNKKLAKNYHNQLKMATTEGHKVIFHRQH